MIVSFLVAARIRQLIRAMVFRTSAPSGWLRHRIRPVRGPNARICRSLLPVVTRNSTASHSDTGAFSWPESAGLALPRAQHALGLVSEPRPQLGVGDVEGVGHAPGRVLPYRAHVQDRHVRGQLVRASQHELTGHHVVGDHAGLVDGVLGLSVGRRVGEVQIDKVRCLQTGPHGGSDDVDAPVHAVGAQGLRAENLPVGTHVHEDVHGLGTGEIARVLVRVRVHREVLRARGVEGLGGERLCKGRGRGRCRHRLSFQSTTLQLLYKCEVWWRATPDEGSDFRSETHPAGGPRRCM